MMPKKQGDLVEVKDAKTAIVMPMVHENELVPRMVMGAEAMKEIHSEKMTFIKDVMKDGHDFGLIPGCGKKPSLWKPGAEKLLQVYGYGSKMERVEESNIDDPSRYEVTYKCTIIHKATGKTMAECEGSVCSEEKNNWNSQARKLKNTMRKMAQKRAFVGATLFATGCSDVFTQDIEDMDFEKKVNTTPPPAPIKPADPAISKLTEAITNMVVENKIPTDEVKKIIFTATRDPKIKLRNIKEKFILEVIAEHVKDLLAERKQDDDNTGS